MTNRDDIKMFHDEPRDYALELVYSDRVDRETLLLACLKYLSHDEVREMLDANELSPRFIFDEDEPDELEFERDWDRGVSPNEMF